MANCVRKEVVSGCSFDVSSSSQVSASKRCRRTLKYQMNYQPETGGDSRWSPNILVKLVPVSVNDIYESVVLRLPLLQLREKILLDRSGEKKIKMIISMPHLIYSRPEVLLHGNSLGEPVPKLLVLEGQRLHLQINRSP